MLKPAILIVIVALFLSCLLALADTPAVQITVEISKPLPRGRNLGTRAYPPTDTENPFLAKVTEKFGGWGEDLLDPDGNTTKPATKPHPYTLKDQDGKYAGWFGIVRDISWDEKTSRTTLLLEHKYFDGLTDLHLQVVSIFGAGDFKVVLSQKLENVPKLSLVRVYGKVAAQNDGSVLITPEYLRVWDWGLFTFMNYGTDQSNPEWVKLRKVNPEDAYSSNPNNNFYETRLGKREPATTANK